MPEDITGEYIISVDIGTTTLRCEIIDKNQQCIGSNFTKVSKKLIANSIFGSKFNFNSFQTIGSNNWINVGYFKFHFIYLLQFYAFYCAD